MITPHTHTHTHTHTPPPPPPPPPSPVARSTHVYNKNAMVPRLFQPLKGVATVSRILRQRGVHLILANSCWTRPAILVAGKGRGGMVLFLLFLYFHSCSSFFPITFISSTIFFISFLPYSGRRYKMTHRVDVSLNPNTIKKSSHWTSTVM